MHTLVFYGALIVMALHLAIAIIMVIRARIMSSRILALDTLSILMIAFLALFADHRHAEYYLDAALILAFLGFVQTLVTVRYYDSGKFFA
jgi:multisubunit Na+/H+ antiporter MnhF subunit